MEARRYQPQPQVPESEVQAPLIIVGNGPAGIQCLVELRRRGQTTPVKLFGAEPWAPYDRVKLSTFLSGSTGFDDLTNLPAELDDSVEHLVGRPVTGINPSRRWVEDALGQRHPYSKLVLALGSDAHIPSIPGTDLSGVLRFRDMADAQALMARRLRSTHTVVIGGGLLGIEAAHGLCRFGTRVTLIQHADRLMNRQLDSEAASLVAGSLSESGVDVRLQTSVRRIEGSQRVESVVLADGTVLLCDTVVFATGIAPRTALARKAGLTVASGIRVNASMQTSNPDIYAVGECAQFQEQVCGLVMPALQQARVAAANLAGSQDSYTPVADSTWLKVMALEVFSAGRFIDEERGLVHQTLVYRQAEKGLYRALMLRTHRLVGVVSVGPWPERQQILNRIADGRRLLPWEIWRFRLSGTLAGGPAPVGQWPASTVVCQCRGLNRGQLQTFMGEGCDTFTLKQRSGAGTVCGGCEPLLDSLCQGGMARARSVPGGTALAILSVMAALLLALAFWLPSPALSSSVQSQSLFEQFSRNGEWRQWSGYGVLGASVLLLLMSLKKRFPKVPMGGFSGWRIAHAAIGSLALALLYWHTGFSLGENLNRWLMLSFIGVAIAGIGAALLTRFQAALPGLDGLRQGSTWLHILVCWPLPVLLIFHIVSAYYF
ncbi:nitrite reductase [Alcanivorax sp. MD8A]|uniref:FAD-dependent oxidoreductase n=1 Tax=Alcanivorax sp. MD8A TaxID=1177157 RepID=UPI000C9CD2E0|nr:FAD-dependent oxidoreductase [Alcanivorax sp. MD8A]PNE01690.1 nitrite reductase [Alcanivorax sp. MD8A]